ncbi:MAG: PDZ domain-containing protein [Solirubrobacteraceae bacterium]
MLALMLVGGAIALGPGGSGNATVPAGAAPAAWLGTQLLSTPGGVLIARVVHGSPAESANLRSGDIITEVDGRPVAAPVNVTAAISALTPGDTLTLELRRGSRSLATRATLASRPANVVYP